MADRKTPAEEAADLRAATREAHEAMKDMRLLLREMRDLKAEVETVAGQVFEDRMAEQVAAGLARYSETIGQAIDDASEAVDRRFDTIASIMLGEEKWQERKGGSLTDMARQIASTRETNGG